MGNCETCAYFFKVDTILLDRYGCKLYNRYVKRNDTCANYTAAPSGGGGCFLTSACVAYMGKEDDCRELTVLRAFRDNYLKNQSGGAELIKEYYEIAPRIVECINSSAEKEKNYAYIYGVIEECIKLIDSGDNGGALEKYKEMVRSLKVKFKL